MFTWREGKMHAEDVSFCLPEGYCYISDVNVTMDESIQFQSEDASHDISFWIENTSAGTEQTLERLVAETDGGVRSFEPVQPVRCNGLDGHQLLYGSDRRQYLETHFQLSGSRQLVLYLSTQQGLQKIKEIRASEAYGRILNGISREER